MTATETPRVERTVLPSQPRADEYRPLSQLAVACFAVSLLAPLALTVPVLWIVPVVVVVLALSALRGVAASDGELRGRGLAVTALALALLFLSWAVAREVGTYVVFARQSRGFVEQWWQMIREGRGYEAHQLTLGYSSRLPAGASLQETYERQVETEATPRPGESEDPEAMDLMTPEMHQPAQLQEAYEAFMNSPAMKDLDRFRGSLRVRFERNLGRNRWSLHEIGIRQLFAVLYEEDGQPRSRQVEMTVVRDCQDKEAFWRIEQVELATDPS